MQITGDLALFIPKKQPLLVSVRQSKFLNALVAAKVVMYLLSCKNMMVLVFRKLSGSSGKNIILKFLKMNCPRKNLKKSTAGNLFRLFYVQQLIFSDNIRLTKTLKNILLPEALPPEIRSWNNITLAMLLPAISSGMNCNGRGTTCNYFRIIP